MLLVYLHSSIYYIPISVKKTKEYFHFGSRRYNVIHCQLRNSASNLNADLYHHSLLDTPECTNCIDSVENAYHYFFVCPKYTYHRNTLLQAIQDITNGYDQQPSLELLLYGSPSHGLKINIKIFEAVQAFIAATKRFV